jgi:hypothetical protein
MTPPGTGHPEKFVEDSQYFSGARPSKRKTRKEESEEKGMKIREP